MEKVGVVWMEDKSGNNIPLNQSLIHSKAVTLLDSVKAKRGSTLHQQYLKLAKLVHEV